MYYYNRRGLLHFKNYGKCLFKIFHSNSISSMWNAQNFGINQMLVTLSKKISSCTTRKVAFVPKYFGQKNTITISKVEDSNSSEEERNYNELPQNTSNIDEIKSKESPNVSTSKPFQRSLMFSKRPSIFLFPGEDSRFVGMGKKIIEYPLIKDMYDVASEILKYDLRKICFEGPESELDKAKYCQPAVLVTSLAAAQKIKNETPQVIENCICAAGFGVGEISALTFSDWISFEDAVRFVKIRSEAMQAAIAHVKSGMMYIHHWSGSKVYTACIDAKEWCKKLGIKQPECSIAHFLYNDCKIIAGHKEALQFIYANAKEYGIKHCKHLSATGAFHTNLMLSAEGPVHKILDDIKINNTRILVLSTVDGKHYTSAKQVQQNLVKQMSSPVNWGQILRSLYPSSNKKNVMFPVTYECGPREKIKSILRNINITAFELCESLGV